MYIVKESRDIVGQNHVSVSDERDMSAVTKAVAELSNKGALYPLTPTLYSSGSEGFVLSGFCQNELDEIAIRIDAKRQFKQMESSR